jgi:uncharacterized membrane protein (UPF0136 family)
MATNSSDSQDIPQPKWSFRWAAAVSLVSGLLVGPFFFGSIALVGSDADRGTKELSLAVAIIGAISLSVVAVVGGIIALVRRSPGDGLAKTGVTLGLGAVILFWSAIALLLYLSAKYF